MVYKGFVCDLELFQIKIPHQNCFSIGENWSTIKNCKTLIVPWIDFRKKNPKYTYLKYYVNF
jgi:hypothetical protein